ncbi:MAG: portal protein [Candidatus Nanopelagicaceae bacterium]
MSFEEETFKEDKLASWVMERVEKWRNHYDGNYKERFEEYYRLWRGQWQASDKVRESERSKLISPALQQAVESAVAEVEEATFGRGKWFDIKDDARDAQNIDIELTRKLLEEEFSFTKTRKAVSEILINAAVYGTGCGELVLEEVEDVKPASQPILDGAAMAVGVMVAPRTVVKLRPVLPQNFLLDPNASSIEEALGVAIDEFVPKHQVEILQEQGVYKDVDIDSAAPDQELEPDQDLVIYQDDKVRLTKYYGLVPTGLYKAYLGEYEDKPEGSEADEKEDKEEKEYTEAIVIIGNGGVCLKVEENPYMMQDRPVVAFSWDVVPGRFWGRGICEKGYNSQKALDAELRARIDGLALTVHPMMAIDGTRMPRGAKFEIRPGKTIITNGNPQEILQPFKFGSIDQITFAQAGELQKMVQMATGAIDAAGIPGSINGEAAAGAVSMSLGAIIKRHKRTLINFQESFLMPLVSKTAWRYMQYDPDRFPAQDFKFVASSSLGVIAREYEVTQLVQLLQTLSDQSPIYPLLVQAVVDNMGIANRETFVEALRQAQQPNPQAQALQEADLQVKLATAKAQIALLEAQAAESQARAAKYTTEAQAVPIRLENDRIRAISANIQPGDQDDKEFEKRARVAELVLKEREIASKEAIVTQQMKQA